MYSTHTHPLGTPVIADDIVHAPASLPESELGHPMKPVSAQAQDYGTPAVTAAQHSIGSIEVSLDSWVLLMSLSALLKPPLSTLETMAITETMIIPCSSQRTVFVPPPSTLSPAL